MPSKYGGLLPEFLGLPATDTVELPIVLAGSARNEELSLSQKLLDGFTARKQGPKQVLAGVGHSNSTSPGGRVLRPATRAY
jgi:hypothetical protein